MCTGATRSQALYVTQTGARYMIGARYKFGSRLGRSSTVADTESRWRRQRLSFLRGLDMVKRLVIVGGGSAGWLTAGVIAAEHRAKEGAGLASRCSNRPTCAPIGVGEGTWPTMRDTLRKIGVSEADFLRDCDASFKQGSKFERWVDGREHDYYFHPFVLPQGYPETNLVAGWLKRHAHHAVRGPGELPAAPVRAGQGAQAGADPGIRGGGQLRLSPRRRQVRHVPARTLRREPGRAPRGRPHDGVESARERRHRGASPRATTARSQATCSSTAPGSAPGC